MQIWVDADACPNAITEIIYRAAERVMATTTFVSNKRLRIPVSDYLKTIQVPPGFNVADQKIIELIVSGDLVISDDIPLAAEVIDKGGFVLNFRGVFFTEENIRERLSIRDFMDGLRSAGVETGGPASFRLKDRQAFANQLDRFLVGRRK